MDASEAIVVVDNVVGKDLESSIDGAFVDEVDFVLHNGLVLVLLLRQRQLVVVDKKFEECAAENVPVGPKSGLDNGEFAEEVSA